MGGEDCGECLDRRFAHTVSEQYSCNRHESCGERGRNRELSHPHDFIGISLASLEID